MPVSLQGFANEYLSPNPEWLLFWQGLCSHISI
jgi:hypothetical protein